MEKQNKKSMLIQKYATQYKVVCIGHFPNFGTTEKCEFCSKKLEKAFYYFQCTKGNETPVTFYTGPECAKALASACKITTLPPLSSPFMDENGARNRAQSEAASAIAQKTLLGINKQFLNALIYFVMFKKSKPSNYIANMICKTREYGTTHAAFPKQITDLSKFIAEDFKGHTLTDMLTALAKQYPGNRLKNFDFGLLRQECEAQNVQSFY